MDNTPTIRGVNLGGWLILERWMTPSLFAGTKARDEYTFMQTPDARSRIEQHRKTFITESDFIWLKDNGVNAVRIPIGYWIFDGDDPHTPAIKYLDWAVDMAEKYDIRVLIDLHGLRGSQNGNDHSGRIGDAGWFGNEEYRKQSIDILERLARRYYDKKSVWGIEIMNEPKRGLLQRKLRRYYKDAYDRLIKVARPGTVVVFHDAFRPRMLSGALKAHKDFPVVMDVHWYQFGGWRKWERLEGYFIRVIKRMKLIRRLQRKQAVIIGEWSLVLTDNMLARRDQYDMKAAFRSHGRLQLETYERAHGWFYWTYKTERRGIWHFRSLVEDGKISFK